MNTTFLKAMPEPGKIAFISHSGALGSAILDWAMEAGIGFSMFASLGSMLDVDFGDLIDYLGEDPQTKSIMIYMEGVGHAKKFMSAARGFARTKPIIILKPGRFLESARLPSPIRGDDGRRSGLRCSLQTGRGSAGGEHRRPVQLRGVLDSKHFRPAPGSP